MKWKQSKKVNGSKIPPERDTIKGKKLADTRIATTEAGCITSEDRVEEDNNTGCTQKSLHKQSETGTPGVPFAGDVETEEIED